MRVRHEFNMQLKKHDFGSSIAIGIQDDNKKDIEETFFSFWNHGATGGELQWVTDNFAYFWTTPEALLHALIESSLFRLLNIDAGRAKGKKDGLMPEAIGMAKQKLAEIENSDFLDSDSLPSHHEYKIGYLEYYSPDLNTL